MLTAAATVSFTEDVFIDSGLECFALITVLLIESKKSHMTCVVGVEYDSVIFDVKNENTKF